MKIFIAIFFSVLLLSWASADVRNQVRIAVVGWTACFLFIVLGIYCMAVDDFANFSNDGNLGIMVAARNTESYTPAMEPTWIVKRFYWVPFAGMWLILMKHTLNR